MSAPMERKVVEDELHEDFRDDFAVDAAKAAADIDTNGGGGAQQQQIQQPIKPSNIPIFQPVLPHTTAWTRAGQPDEMKVPHAVGGVDECTLPGHALEQLKPHEAKAEEEVAAEAKKAEEAEAARIAAEQAAAAEAKKKAEDDKKADAAVVVTPAAAGTTEEPVEEEELPVAGDWPSSPKTAPAAAAAAAALMVDDAKEQKKKADRGSTGTRQKRKREPSDPETMRVTRSRARKST